MNNRPKDVPYCGVDQTKIQTASPAINPKNLKRLTHFITERYAIHIKKDVLRQAPPWTSDPILQTFKFTNVRREHDRQSKYLIENICQNPDLGHRSKMDNVFLCRAWNNWDTMKDFGGPWTWNQIEDPAFKETIRPIYHELLKKNPDRRWWSAAYNQGGTKYAWKFPDGEGFGRAKSEEAGSKFPDYEADIPLRTFHIGPWLNRAKIHEKLWAAKSQKEVYQTIMTLRGYSTFLAYQMFVDLTYIPEFPFSENEFTVAGPGCRRGIDYLFNDKDGMSYEECIFWMRDYLNWALDLPHIFTDLPKEDQCMNVMSMENCFCEISKYIRAVNGTGRPKVKYNGRGEV